jgi:hypothetical protein
MKINQVRVENMTSARGNDIPNQFRIYTDDGVYFQSYSSIIAFRPHDGKIVLDAETWDYSTATGKYRNQFLREGIAETREKIKDGTYILDNLN